MSKRCVLPLTLLMFAGAAAAQGWQLEPRELPPPAGASDALRDSIAGQPRPDRATRMNVPDSREAWQALVLESKRASTERALALIEAAPLSVAEDSLGGVPVHRITPDEPADAFRGKVYMDLHGGAYVYGGGKAGLTEALLIAERLGIETIAVDYRMPPLDEPFPAAVDDAVLAYLALLDSYSPGAIAVGGTSAGGGLTLALVHRLKAIGAPLPGALYTGTPWSDLTKTGDTEYSLEGIDRVLVTYDGSLQADAALYIGINDWKDPLISPVYGDFAGFPPTVLITGTRDLFLSDVARTHRKLRAAGVEADLHVYEGISHAGYYIWRDTPESIDAYREIEAFFRQHLE